MNINIDRITGKVALSPSNLTFNVTVEDDFNPSKTIEVIEGQKQKANEQGQFLYKTNNGSFEETTEARTVTKTEPKEVVNKWTDEENVEHSEAVEVEEPIEWVDNEPVFIDNIVNKTITFAEDPTAFTAEEILKSKYQSLLDNNSSYDYILADIFLNEEDIELSDKNHAANTGVAIMQLLPNGQAKTKTITLANSASIFSLLELEGNGVNVIINDVQFVNNKATLAADTDTVVIKFVNATNKPVDVKSYAIAY